MEGNMKSYRTSQIIYRLVSKDAFAAYTIFCWVFGAILNMFGAFWIVRVDANLKPEDDTKQLWLRIMSFFLSGFSLFCLILWFTFRYSQRRNISREDFIFDNPGVDPNSFGSRFKISIFKSILTRGTPVNMTLHILFSMIGVFYSWFILSLNLMLVVNISRTCKFVIKAITLHADQLILTLVMTFFVIYSYTVLLGEHYYDTLDLGDTDPDLCYNLYTCFVYTMNWGLRNGGGIADSMNYEPKGNRFFAKNMYDVTFFMIVNVIALNIIFGIIIDTFSQLRDDQHERGKSTHLKTQF